MSFVFSRINKVLFLIAIFNCVLINNVFSQHDTTYYKQYPHKLVLTLYQSLIREHNIQFSQDNSSDSLGISTLNYASQAKSFTGLAFDYDLFGLSIGVNTLPTESTKKGNSHNTNIGFTFGSNKLSFEASYRNYKGFYEKNTANYTPNFTEQTPYFQKASMQFIGLKFKVFYYSNNKKFSYKAAYASTHRQLKSAWSPIYSAGLYYNNLGTDSTFFPYQIRIYYERAKNVTNVGVTGLSTGAGLSGNLVFGKKFFINATGLLALESQWRNYEFLNGENVSRGYFALGGDFRASIGYNSEKFMCFISSMYDFSKWNNANLNINNQFLSGQINFAYRFGVKKPKWYHVIEDNKIYKWF